MSGTLYKLIRLLSARTGSLLDISKICSLLALDRRKTSGYVELLEKTYFIHTITPFARSTDREISHRRKVYIADTGILNLLAQVSSGQVFENAVYLQMLKQQRSIQFYQRKSGQEVDFILDQKVACEVKETPHLNDWAKLNSRSAYINIDDKMLIGKTPPGDGWHDFIWAGVVF